MSKINKMIVGIVVVVLVVGVALLVGQSGLFQGRLSLFSKVDLSRIFLYKNRVVSAVTSPVSSIVISNMASRGGISRVGSVVTSPVASVVALRKDVVGIDTAKLAKLTAGILESIAKEDYKKNPARFVLSADAKNTILKMYTSKYPSEFIYRQ